MNETETTVGTLFDTLANDVKQLIAEVDATHRYSMSRIYGLYNQAFGANETPQSCASCLIRKVKQLRNWLEQQPAVEPETVKTETSESSEATKTPKAVKKRKAK